MKGQDKIKGRLVASLIQFYVAQKTFNGKFGY